MPRRFVVGIAAALAAGYLGCGNDATAPDEPGPPTAIAGTWTYYEEIGNTSLQITCQDQGTLAIVQDGADFTGTANQTGACYGPGGSADNSGTAAASGNVGAATIRFGFAGCSYRGDLHNTPRDSATGTVSCRVDIENQRIGLTGTWLAVRGIEFDPPTVSATIQLPPGDTLFVTGEILRLKLTAHDDRKLHRVGYRLGPPANVQDSVVVLDSQYVDSVEFTVPASWAGASDITVFARDAFDRSTESSAGHVRALDAVRRPFQTVPLGARAVDLVYDPSRNVLYLSEPESTRVAVLALATFTLGAPIPVPISPRGYGSMGIDLVPGGDTVVVALPESARVAFLDRLGGTVSTATITDADHIDNVRVTANRKALIFGSGQIGGGYIAFSVWERDLATGTVTRRTDIGITGNVNALTPLVRSPDQSKVLLLDQGTGCAQVYDAAAGGFSSCSQFGFSSFWLGTATTTGDKWLVGNKLVDGSLALLATVPTLNADALSGMAPDGSVAYQPTTYGYDKIALPTGAVLERVRIPFIGVTRITVLPDGARLFLWSDAIGSPPAWGTNRATIVTLSP